MIIYKSLTVSILVLFLMLSCNDSDDNNYPRCDYENSLEELEWLKEKKNQIEMNTSLAGGQIIRYLYRGEYVFWIDDCYFCTDQLILIYNCDGEVICEFGGFLGLNTCPDFNKNATDRTVLFDNSQDK